MVNFQTPLLLAAAGLLVSSVSAKNVVYDCSQTPEVCLNTCWAINCAGHPATLHGAGQASTSASKKYGKKNRQAWGYNSKPCTSKGWKWTTSTGASATSPDEYPYASSKEGGLSYNGKTVALRCVPSKEQSKQGAKVKGIGTDKTTGTWKTSWTNINSLSQNWCASTRTCKNDGHQFTSKGSSGPFSSAKRDDDDVFELAEDPEILPRGITNYSDDGNTAYFEEEYPEDVDDESEEYAN